MMRGIFVACGLPAFLLLAASALAQSTAADPVTQLLALDQSQLKKIVADLVSARSDIFDLKYVEPDGSEKKAGWALAYNWSAQAGRSELSAQGNHYILNSLSYNVNVDGSYAFSDAVNNS